VRVVLTRLSAFGDIVHTWPLAVALAAGGHEVGWVVEEPLRPLVESHPAVARVFAVATRRWRRRPAAPTTLAEVRECCRELRGWGAAVALDPQGLLKSAAWAALAWVPRRIGLHRAVRRERLAGVFYTETVRPAPTAEHVVDRNLALLSALGLPRSEGATPDGRFLLGDRPPTAVEARRPVVLVAGTGQPRKAWPTGQWSELATRLASSGVAVVVAWGPGEEPLARAIVDGAGPGPVVAPSTSIRELADLLAGAAAVVGADTGPVHLAASLGAPTIGVFVATDPRRTGPRGIRARAVAGSPPGVATVARAVQAALEVSAVT
jgi:heptosyltransferase-1